MRLDSAMVHGQILHGSDEILKNKFCMTFKTDLNNLFIRCRERFDGEPLQILDAFCFLSVIFYDANDLIP